MYIGFISDLHISEKEEQFLSGLVEIYESNNLDLLIIGGDISNDIYFTISFVKKLANLINVKYIVGNHDLFNVKNKLSTNEIEQLIIDDENSINNKVLKLNDSWSIVAHIGWYDYTLGNNERFTYKDFERMSFKGSIWQDKKYISYTDNNVHTHDLFIKQVKNLIDSVDTKNIILVNHMLNNPKFKVSQSGRAVVWDYFNAFMGSTSLYELSLNSKIKYAICGHVHYRASFIKNETTYICACLGYEKEYNNFEFTIKKRLENAIQIIEIGE